jgi:hypothetical protein
MTTSFLLLLLLLVPLLSPGALGVGAATLQEEEEQGQRQLQAISAFDCQWNWRNRRCEPADLCVYHYRLLDATIGESCRPIADVALKGSNGRKRIVSSAALKLRPLALLSMAAAVFAADLGAIAFTPVLTKFPAIFNIFQGFALFLSGDMVFQVLEQGWAKQVGFKVWRAVRSGLIGALNNGIIHYRFYQWIDANFPYHMFSESRFGPRDSAFHKLSVANAKYWLEWPTMGVYKIASNFFLTALMAGDLKGLTLKFKRRFLLTWLRSLQIWPIYDTLLYAYVPTNQRVLWNSIMSLAWGGYLSSMSQEESLVADAVPPASPAATTNTGSSISTSASADDAATATLEEQDDESDVEVVLLDAAEEEEGEGGESVNVEL